MMRSDLERRVVGRFQLGIEGVGSVHILELLETSKASAACAGNGSDMEQSPGVLGISIDRSTRRQQTRYCHISTTWLLYGHGPFRGDHSSSTIFHYVYCSNAALRWLTNRALSLALLKLCCLFN